MTCNDDQGDAGWDILRGGTAALRIETGSWNGLKKKERICRQCTMGEIEDVELAKV